MNRSSEHTHPRRRQRGQILVLAVLGMVALIGGVALVLEAGNTYAQQRGVQNGADAAANAGATVLAQRLGGATKTDADVLAAVNGVGTSNNVSTSAAPYYTDVYGHPLDTGGNIVAVNAAASVGGGTIPPNAQGVHVGEARTFGTFFGRVIGVSQMGAAADATAVTGRLTGGVFLPVVFPVNIVDCNQNGSLGTGESNWVISNPGNPPAGPEYIVPLCKTGGGSFMILDLDGTPNNCDDEVTNPPNIQFATFPADVQSDNGNNCAKRMVDAVNALHGHVVFIPICDGDCVTGGGSHATYHIIKVTAFWLDYMSDQNGGNNTQCQGNGTTLVPIAGNGSSSCVAGWFVRYITTGPVGAGPIGNSDSIGVQLIK
jgi:hypothetical protein